MTYEEQERLGITQHGHGVTVAMNYEQYEAFHNAMIGYRNLTVEQKWPISQQIAQGMLDDIEERGI